MSVQQRIPGAGVISGAVDRYAATFNALDRDGWLANFVEIPELIEPADAAMRKGREHLIAVFDQVVASGLSIVLTPLRVIVNGSEAAVLMGVQTTQADQVRQSSVIEIFSFAADGRIARMKAFLEAADAPSAKVHTEA